MPERYGQEAIETARRLYCNHGGGNHDAIQAGMRKAGYPKWCKSTLLDKKGGRGGKTLYDGWITKYGFDRSLEIYSKQLVESVQNEDQRDYLQLQEICSRLKEKASHPDATRDDLYIYRDFFRLKLEVRSKIDVGDDNFETYANVYALIADWLPDIDPVTAKGFLKCGEKLLERAEAHYGNKAEGKVERADTGETQGGERPPAAKTLRLVS